MVTIADLLQHRTIHCIKPEQTVFEAAHYMVDCNVGAAPVLEGTQLVGVFSERDLMRRVVVEGRNPLITRVEDVMTRELYTVNPGDNFEEALSLMKEHSIRHLPVCDGGTLVGFLSLRDLLLHDIHVKSGEVDMMRAYISAAS